VGGVMFEVGDRVTCISEELADMGRKGKRGVIVRIERDHFGERGSQILVEYEDGIKDSCVETDIEVSDNRWTERIRACIAKRTPRRKFKIGDKIRSIGGTSTYTVTELGADRYYLNNSTLYSSFSNEHRRELA
jgi:hypothetical protein